MTVQDATPVELVAEEFLEARLYLLDPWGAYERCHVESEDFQLLLGERGIVSCIVSGLLLDGNMVISGHFGVLVDGMVWDWTARQFDASMPVPRVVPVEQFRSEWTAVMGDVQ